MNKISMSLALAALLMYGCSEKPNESSSNTTETQKEVAEPAVKAPVTAEEPVQNLYGATTKAVQQHIVPESADIQASAPHVAKVLETMDAAGYTYVKVDENGNTYWIAGPKTNLTVGSTISYIEQMVMKDFTSKALNRTFDYLMFANSIIPASVSTASTTLPVADKAHNCDTCGPTDVNTTMQQSQVKPPQAKAKPISVAKLEGGHSIEELYAQKSDLNGTTVTFNAEVIKVSKNIMGKDWVHLQDGTGVAGSNDITATGLNAAVNVGDIVTAKGTLKTDVDLGYGYFFPVILEESAFTVN